MAFEAGRVGGDRRHDRPPRGGHDAGSLVTDPGAHSRASSRVTLLSQRTCGCSGDGAVGRFPPFTAAPSSRARRRRTGRAPHHPWAPRRARRRALGRGRLPRPARAAWLRRPAPARSTSFMNQRDAKGEGREATESGHHDHDHDEVSPCARVQATGTYTRTPQVSMATHRTRRPLDHSLARGHQGGLSLARRAHGDGAGAGGDLRSLGQRRSARRPHPQRRRRAHRCAFRHRLLLALLSRREGRRVGGRRRDLSECDGRVVRGRRKIRFIHPKELTHLGHSPGPAPSASWKTRLRHRSSEVGRRLASPALVADGKHARVDGFVSLGVIASAALVAFGLERADPVVGILITVVILRITWDAWRTILDDSTRRGYRRALAASNLRALRRPRRRPFDSARLENLTISRRR